MVTDDRAQLILVGALVIALAIVGLTVVVNTAVFTDTAGSYGTTETIKDGGEVGQDVEQAVGATVRGVNQEGGDLSQIDTTINASVGNITADGSGGFVGVSDVRESNNGSLISGGVKDGVLVNHTKASAIGEFAITVQGELDPISVTLNETDVGEQEVTIFEDNDNISIDVDDDVVCENIEGDTVTIDILRGWTTPGGCTFDPVGDLQPNQIELSGSDGHYNITIDAEDYNPDINPDDGYPRDIYWAVDVDYIIDTGEVTFEADDREVPVYP